MTAADLDLFVSHQANRRIIMSAAERSGWPSKVIINIDRFGNTTAATIPLALNDAIADGRLTKGKLVMLTSVVTNHSPLGWKAKRVRPMRRRKAVTSTARQASKARSAAVVHHIGT